MRPGYPWKPLCDPLEGNVIKEDVAADGSMPRIAWWPMAFAAAIAFLPINLAVRANGTPPNWTLTWVAVLAYIALFAVVVAQWQRRRPFAWVILPLALLGMADAPLNYLAVIFFWTAASVVPWALRGHVSRTIQWVTPILVAWVVEGSLTASSAHLRHAWLLHAPLLMLVLVAGNTWIVQALLAAQDLAKASERDRIARDLHDVVGHSLSVITLKAELAAWLLTQPEGRLRACREMAEVEGISRRALTDIRDTVLDARVDTLAAELERTAMTLRTAGVSLAYQCERSAIDAQQERILCLALREAVTNIVRHANAKSCRVRVQSQRDGHVLEVQDDGRGGGTLEGQGLKGMRERAEAGGGSVSRDTSAGTRLTVRLPLARVDT